MIMLQALLPGILGLIGKSIDKAIPDKDEAEKLKAQITLAAMEQDHTELEGAVKIITSEANGESWLQRNWRPITALVFTSLVVAHWLGFTPPNLPNDQVLHLMDIVQMMIGGYVVSRGSEKVIKTWKEKS